MPSTSPSSRLRESRCNVDILIKWTNFLVFNGTRLNLCGFVVTYEMVFVTIQSRIILLEYWGLLVVSCAMKYPWSYETTSTVLKCIVALSNVQFQN
ncbi:hypothetical protein Y032_0051g2162 [Ancylostoma ceylanicum]|uniref:Uncharacterized protein n=1 Tax=Ancylostoma ceylanicum TaxID=53326 RepID=A0A016U843_9BILA|nr:hypothetical protein Y032_0051g2162 [Ancylostoma ceylanicum]